MDQTLTAHGGLDAAELRSLGLRPEQVLDFSANVNLLGPSARVRQAAAEADISAYPDRHSLALREALATRLGVGLDRLLVGNGAAELIHLLARACIRPGDRCLIFGPTFGEYQAAAEVAGAELHWVQADEARGFGWDLDAGIRRIQHLRPRLVFLCNPNNPTGTYLGPNEATRILDAVGDNGLLALDDAFAPLADCPWNSSPLLAGGNLAIVRSMTKAHALAGARLGYLVAEPKVVSAARRLQPAWSVNAVAQAAGIAALDDADHVAAARRVISRAKAYLYRELEAMGIPAVPSAANFILVRVGDARKVRGGLLRLHIAVRDCTSFGLPEYIRIAVRGPDECARLVAGLREVLADD